MISRNYMWEIMTTYWTSWYQELYIAYIISDLCDGWHYSIIPVFQMRNLGLRGRPPELPWDAVSQLLFRIKWCSASGKDCMFRQSGGRERSENFKTHHTKLWGLGRRNPLPPLLLSNLKKDNPASPPGLSQLSEMSPDKGPGPPPWIPLFQNPSH